MNAPVNASITMTIRRPPNCRRRKRRNRRSPRIDLPQDAVDFISQRMVPGSSLIVSDQGLGDETGEGTDFIVVSH